MCLAIPGKIETVEGQKALVNFGGVKRRVDLSFLEDAAKNDWVLFLHGFPSSSYDWHSLWPLLGYDKTGRKE